MNSTHSLGSCIPCLFFLNCVSWREGKSSGIYCSFIEYAYMFSKTLVLVYSPLTFDLFSKIRIVLEKLLSLPSSPPFSFNSPYFMVVHFSGYTSSGSRKKCKKLLTIFIFRIFSSIYTELPGFSKQ